MEAKVEFCYINVCTYFCGCWLFVWRTRALSYLWWFKKILIIKTNWFLFTFGDNMVFVNPMAWSNNSMRQKFVFNNILIIYIFSFQSCSKHYNKYWMQLCLQVIYSKMNHLYNFSLLDTYSLSSFIWFLYEFSFQKELQPLDL